ncbi:MAG: class I SAM-dependent rRNA methyltransferase [Gammaproteobacteria bacterium]|nr:class I SAM-dependent rRNA methyltransferase [Gammaproteobacteria bacterium]
MDFTPVRLKKDQDRRLRFGHCWVYSNEINTAVTPLSDLQPGQPVDVISHQGKWLGSGYVNPHSLICVRLVSRDHKHPLTESLLVHRLKIALALRQRLFSSPFYRLVFGESDGLPGLVIDRFGDYLVIQVTTAGMEHMKEGILAAVAKVVKPVGVLFRNDSQVRTSEGLERYVEEGAGEWPDPLELHEQGGVYLFPSRAGQKTGWYYDQAENRGRMTDYVEGKRVLDVCSYVGAWGVLAALGGASEVVCVDASKDALSMLEQNAVRNGVGDRVTAVQNDAFEALRELRAARETFDVVMLDPPAFIKRRKDIRQGELAYRRLNQLALQVLSKDGILITSSCSHHMSGERLLHVVQQAARHVDRSLQLLEQGAQSRDHPIHPAIPETAYLKTFYLRVLPSF